MQAINGRTFIISGGSSGLGLATANDLLGTGAYIAIFDIQPAPAFLSSSSKHMKFWHVNVTDVAQVEQAIEEAASWSKETGAPLGGLINAAGGGAAELIINRNLQPHSAKTWDDTIRLNLSGTFHLTRFAAKHLATVTPGEDGERGVIIMISSTVSYEGQQGQTAYAAVKGAINAMTLPLARDLARYGIRVVTIAPGVFRTPLIKTFGARVEEGIISRALLHPKRYGEPEEFARTVRWILDTPMVNAEIIKLTGGARYGASRL